MSVRSRDKVDMEVESDAVSKAISLDRKRRNTADDIKRIQAKQSDAKKAKRRRALAEIARRKKAAEAAKRGDMEIETNAY